MNIVVLSLALGVGSAAATQQHEHGAATDEKLGTVAFATSCSAAAQSQFNRAVALLHSFEFGRAIDAFTTTLNERSVLRDGRVGHRLDPLE